MKSVFCIATALLAAFVFLAQPSGALASESRLERDLSEMAAVRKDMQKALAAHQREMRSVRADMSEALLRTLRQMEEGRRR
ncbi:MAG: hypothetical protein RIB84_01880 [Sneathiellaceae bacterium]